MTGEESEALALTRKLKDHLKRELEALEDSASVGRVMAVSLKISNLMTVSEDGGLSLKDKLYLLRDFHKMWIGHWSPWSITAKAVRDGLQDMAARSLCGGPKR